jgi:hypothetical protein
MTMGKNDVRTKPASTAAAAAVRRHVGRERNQSKANTSPGIMAVGCPRIELTFCDKAPLRAKRIPATAPEIG